MGVTLATFQVSRKNLAIFHQDFPQDAAIHKLYKCFISVTVFLLTRGDIYQLWVVRFLPQLWPLICKTQRGEESMAQIPDQVHIAENRQQWWGRHEPETCNIKPLMREYSRVQIPDQVHIAENRQQWWGRHEPWTCNIKPLMREYSRGQIPDQVHIAENRQQWWGRHEPETCNMKPLMREYSRDP